MVDLLVALVVVYVVFKIGHAAGKLDGTLAERERLESWGSSQGSASRFPPSRSSSVYDREAGESLVFELYRESSCPSPSPPQPKRYRDDPF